MRATLALFFFLSRPFWEAKPPEKWTDHELDLLFHASPWGAVVGPSPELIVYLATAAPLEEAEAELRVRSKHPLAEPDPDYANYLRENRENVLVVAIPYSQPILSAAVEERRMEDESEMRIGRKSYKLVGHFPPTLSDPVLRLVFPREVKPTDKSAVFRLFVPGVSFPEREVEFRVKDMIYRGKLEM